MARDKTSITLDRAKAECARALVDANSVSDAIDLALDRLIFEARVQQDVAAYQLHPQGAEERAIARRQPRRTLDDDPTDWEAFYANRKRQAAQASEDTVRAIAESYLRREGPKLRSAGERRKTFERLILPTWGPRQIDSIRRSDIVKLLDTIEDKSGPRMAQLVLAYISRLFKNVGYGREAQSLMIMVTARIIINEEEEQEFLGNLPRIPR